MNGNRHVESTSRKEIFDLLKRCGPLTVVQIDKIRRKTRSNFGVRWLLRNGYLGMLPTYPAKFVVGSLEYVASEVPEGMRCVLDALKTYGPATSLEIGERVGKTRECIDVQLRIARANGTVHRSGEKRLASNMTAYVWSIGPGANYVRDSKRQQDLRQRAEEAKPIRIVRSSVNVHRDPLVEAFFGVAA
jgi:hypothetical protein